MYTNNSRMSKLYIENVIFTPETYRTSINIKATVHTNSTLKYFRLIDLKLARCLARLMERLGGSVVCCKGKELTLE